MYKYMIVLTLSLFVLFGIFNDVEATNVYVIGSPTDLRKRNKTLPVDIRVVDSPSYGQNTTYRSLKSQCHQTNLR